MLILRSYIWHNAKARRDLDRYQKMIKLLGMLRHGDLPLVGWLLDLVGWLYFSRCALQWGDFTSKGVRKVQHSYVYAHVFVYFWADAHRRLRRITRLSISSQCGLESCWIRTCFRNIFLRFFGTYLLEIDGFLGASEFPKAPAKGLS